MALHFAARIHALTGFDADSTTDTDTGQDFDEHTAQWMTEAAKEVINLLPPRLLEQTAVIETNQNMNDGDGYDVEGKILKAFRALNSSFLDGQVYQCRRIPFEASFKAVDPDSMEYATPTDPVYYIEPQSDNTAGELHIRPKDTGQNVSKVMLAYHPTFTAGDSGTYDVSNATSIANFPDEAEELVVLRAAISALEYQAAIEEDLELYIPIIQNLRQDYMQGLQALGVVQAQPQPQQAGR